MFREKFFSAVACILILLIAVSPSALTGTAVGTLPQKNTEARHIVCTSLSDEAKAYYQNEYSYESLSRLAGAKDAATSGAAMKDNPLYTALHTLMADTHSYYTSYSGYNSGSLAYFWESTDAVADSESYVMFYSDVPAGSGYQLNREHIWPKSRASFDTALGGADLHHLRPSVDSVNRAKSDHTFGYVNGTFSSGYTAGGLGDTVLYYVNSGADLFECKDDVKGDVARILLYVYCRWEQPNLYSLIDSADLPALDKGDKTDNGKPVIESLDTLLEWCALDPVDTWEMKRNDLVEQVQGNRNVFIDYPELAWQLFGQKLPDGMATPSHADGGRILLLGDVDGDGAVTILDATCIQRVLTSLSVKTFVAACSDTDVDGSLTILDATCIQRRLADLPSDDRIGLPITDTQTS